MDTAPQAAVDLPMSPIEAGRAAGDVSTVLLIRFVVAGVAAVLLLVGAVLLFDHGVRTDHFPSFVSGVSTSITRYSGPWIGAAAGLALLAGLALTSCLVDLFRWSRLRRTERVGSGSSGS
jgi:hypothetical protein